MVGRMSTVALRDIELQYDMTGKGPAFIWGHGLTSSRAKEDVFGLLDWSRLTADHTIVRYDARGHGLSASSADPSTYHWRELALDQLALADALGIDHYVAGG